MFQKGCVRGSLTLAPPPVLSAALVCAHMGPGVQGPATSFHLYPEGTHLGGQQCQSPWPFLSAFATCSYPAHVPSWPQKAPLVSVSSRPIHVSEGDRRGPWVSILQAPEKSAFCASHLMTATGIHRTECFADIFMVSSPSILEWLLCQRYRQESRVSLPMSLIQKMVGLRSGSLFAWLRSPHSLYPSSLSCCNHGPSTLLFSLSPAHPCLTALPEGSGPLPIF